MIRQNRFGGQYMQRPAAPQAPGTQTSDGSAPGRMALAMAYLADQPFEDLYETPEALTHGTLFRQLDMPFHGCFRV